MYTFYFKLKARTTGVGSAHSVFVYEEVGSVLKVEITSLLVALRHFDLARRYPYFNGYRATTCSQL